MSPQETPLEPQQERSRRTLENLLAATIRTLHESGLEGATIPRIAEAAGVSPATVYRRFEDKKDLLRAAFLHMLESSQTQNRMHLAKGLSRPTLEQTARRFVELNFAQFRQAGQLLGALQQFMDTDGDSKFRQAARRIVEGNLKMIFQVMLTHRKEIAHEDPELAVRIAVLTTTNAIETNFFKPHTAWRALQPMTEKTLMDELTRALVAYLKSAV
ncbi:MAG TPA: TetR/AcrR family transcriptional regulator [Gammaproteobacteria bacterium]